MKDMARPTAANRGKSPKTAARKQEQPPTGATAGMKPEHQTGATNRNTTKNGTIAAADRDHAADPVSIQGKPEIDVIFNYVKNDFVAANVLCGRLLYSDVLNNRILIYAEIADETADMIKTMLKEAKR